MNWQIFFEDVPDFRINRRKNRTAEAAQFIGYFSNFLELLNGIPSHDTFNGVFKFLDKEAFGESLFRWSKEILSAIDEVYTQINIDGKVLRATAKSGAKKSGLCLLSAWVSDHQLILGQEQVKDKSNRSGEP